MNPPPLYLWSRPDWTAKHMAIAQQHGHSSRVQEKPHLEDDHDLNGQPLVGIDGYLEQSELHEPLQERGASVSKIQKEGIPVGTGDSNVPGNRSPEKNQTNKYPNKKKKQRNKGKQGREFSTERHANYGISESHSNFRTGCGPAFAADNATGYGNSNVEGGNLGGQFGLYQRENTDSRGNSRSYVSEIERHTMEYSRRPHFQPYGLQDPSSFGQRSTFLGGQAPGHLGLAAADLSYDRMNMSTMQRYAPRLDELNHARTNTSGYQPVTAGRNGISYPRPPQSGYIYNSMFAPGAYGPFWQ